MPELNLRSIEPLVTILLVLVQAKRRKQCLTASQVTGLTRRCDAQSVRANLVSSGIIRGERRFAPASASIASRRAAKVTTIGWAGSKSLLTGRPKTARAPHDASYLATRGIFEDAADFASHCQDHDGPLIAAQLKAVADDYERRADKASRRYSQGFGSPRALNTRGMHELTGSFPQQLSGRPKIELRPKVDPVVGGEGAVSSRVRFGIPGSHPSEKRAVQVPRLGLEMRGLPDLQTKLQADFR
jgi:hypothetical protein